MKRAVVAVATLSVLGLALPITNLVGGPPEGALANAQTASPQGRAEILPLLTTKCANCHTALGKRPIYANLPIAKALIDDHIADALRHLDLGKLLGDARPLPPAVVVELEHTLAEDEMPPFSYIALHWDGIVNEAEKAALMRWLKAERDAAQEPAPSATPP